jgi:hypothetical protein
VRLHEHGRADVVTACDVGEELGEQVTAAGQIPQVMMRIDDRELGRERLLAAKREPLGAHR